MYVDKRTVLIIDDDSEVRSMVADILEDEGYSVMQAADWKSAELIVRSEPINLVFLDLWIDENEYDGIVILEKLKKKYPSIPVVMISGHGNIEIAVKAIKYGAYDFIEKPFVIERMLVTASRAIESATLKLENVNLKRKKYGSDVVLVGSSPSMGKVKALSVKAASVNSMVYMLSEKGCCADDLAWLIHCNSSRKDRRFLTFDCAIADQSIASKELFGISSTSRGLIRNLNGGTLFLDNIFELNQDNQALLLKYLQTGKVGDISTDTRIICNSYNQSIDELIDNGQVNSQLFHRLSVMSIEIPALRSRRQDIECIIDYFYKNSFVIFGISNPPVLTNQVKCILSSYTWPGNIKQFKNVLENLFLTAPGKEVVVSDLPKEVFNIPHNVESTLQHYSDLSIKNARELFEKEYILHQLNKFNYNMTKVANFIGMDRSAFYKKVKFLNIDHAQDF